MQAEGDARHLSVLPIGKQSSSGQEFTTECWLINDPCAAQNLAVQLPFRQLYTVCPAVCSILLTHDGKWSVQLSACCLAHLKVLFCTGSILEIVLKRLINYLDIWSTNCFRSTFLCAWIKVTAHPKNFYRPSGM